MNRGLALIVTLLVLIVAGLILYFSGEGVEDDIRDRTQTYLEENDLNDKVKVEVEGRAVYLTTSVPKGELDQAIEEIDAMAGVRRPVVDYDPSAFPKPPFDPLTLAYKGYLSPSSVLVETDMPAGLDAEDTAKVETTKSQLADFLTATRPQVLAGDFKLENGLLSGMARVPEYDPASTAVDENLPTDFQRGLVVLNAKGPDVLAKLEGSELALTEADRFAILGVKPWDGQYGMFVTASGVQARGKPPVGASTAQAAQVEKETKILESYAEGLKDELVGGAFLVLNGKIDGAGHVATEEAVASVSALAESTAPTGLSLDPNIFSSTSGPAVAGMFDEAQVDLKADERMALLGVEDWAAEYAVFALPEEFRVAAKNPEDLNDAQAAQINSETAQIQSYFHGLKPSINFGRFDVIDGEITGTAQSADPSALSDAMMATRPQGLRTGDLNLSAEGIDMVMAFAKHPAFSITQAERAAIMGVDLTQPIIEPASEPTPAPEMAAVPAVTLPALKLATVEGQRLMTGTIASQADLETLQAMFPDAGTNGVTIDAASPTSSAMVNQIKQRRALFAGFSSLNFDTSDKDLAITGLYSSRNEFDLLNANRDLDGGLLVRSRGNEVAIDGTLRLENQISDVQGLFPAAQTSVTGDLGSAAGAISKSKLEAVQPWMDRLANYDAWVTDAGIEIQAYPSNADERAALTELLQQPAILGTKPSFDVAANYDMLGSDFDALSEEDRSAGWMGRFISFSPEKARCRRQFARALSEDKVLFESGSANIDTSSAIFLERLVKLAKICLSNTGLKMIIDGHTDSSGDAAANKALSNKRAVAVRWHLVQAGLDENSIEAFGYGEEFPIADNETPEGREQNRRIEIKIED